MSLDLSTPLKALGRPLQDSLRELRRGYQSVSECLEQALADCEQRGAELADCRRQLAEARRSLTECERQIGERTRGESELSNRCAALKKHFEAKSAELAQANERILALQGECTQSAHRLQMQVEQTEQLKNQLNRLEADHVGARDELKQLRGQFAPLAETAAEAGRLRGELSAAQADIARLREQLSTPGANGELSAQLAGLQVERNQLQSELDNVRHRATELTEAFSASERVAAAEREHWSEELRHMRQVLERQGEAWTQRAEQASADSSALAIAKERLIQIEAELGQAKERLQIQHEHNDQFRDEIKRLEHNRETARDELAQLRGQFTPLAETASESARLRGELVIAQAEIDRLRQEVSSPAGGAELQSQLFAMQSERQQLQGELEALRQRSLDLSEALTDQKRHADTQRDEWSAQLRQMREALERQSEAWGQRADQSAADAQALADSRERVVRAESEVAQGRDRLQVQLEQIEQHRQEIKRLEQHREAARDELAQLRVQFAPLAESAADSARLRGELSAAQAEIERLRNQVAKPGNDVELQAQLFAIQSERQQLQGELAAVRCRANDLGEALAEQQRQAISEREHWSEELRQMRETLERQSATWAERAAESAEAVGAQAAADLAAAGQRLLESESEGARHKERLQIQLEQNEQLRREIQQLEEARGAVSGELAELQAQLAPLAESASEAAQLKAQLETARADLLRANEQAQSTPEVEPLRQKLAASEVERQQLENELDLLRHRGAELSQQLAELKRTAAAEREQWNEELRQLRKAVEMQSEALAHHAATPRATNASMAPPVAQGDTVSDNTRRTSSPGATRAEDSVLGSVMEQFEALQKSKVRNLARPKR